MQKYFFVLVAVFFSANASAAPADFVGSWYGQCQRDSLTFTRSFRIRAASATSIDINDVVYDLTQVERFSRNDYFRDVTWHTTTERHYRWDATGTRLEFATKEIGELTSGGVESWTKETKGAYWFEADELVYTLRESDSYGRVVKENCRFRP